MTNAKAGLNAAGGKNASKNKRLFAKRTAKKGKAELRAMTKAKVNYNTADVGRQSQNKKPSFRKRFFKPVRKGNNLSKRGRKRWPVLIANTGKRGARDSSAATRSEIPQS